MRGVMLACSRGKIVAGALRLSCTEPISSLAVLTATIALGLGGSSSCLAQLAANKKEARSTFRPSKQAGQGPSRGPRGPLHFDLALGNELLIVHVRPPGPRARRHIETTS